MATQICLDKAYMECAFAIAKLSQAERRKVGAVLVSPTNQIIAEGYNGTPSGFENKCEIESFSEETECKTCDGTGDVHSHNPICWTCRGSGKTKYRILTTKPEVLHAESNCLLKVAKSTNSSEGSTLYITCSPCFDCSKLIIQAGVKRVVYWELYRKTEGIELLQKAGILVESLK